MEFTGEAASSVQMSGEHTFFLRTRLIVFSLEYHGLLYFRPPSHFILGIWTTIIPNHW